MKQLRIYLLTISLGLMGACQQGNAPESMATTDQDHDHTVSENEVHLLKQQMDVMEISLGHFQELNLSTTVKANGHLQLPPQKKASLSAVMSGRIKEIFVLEGDYVKQGQILATLEHPDFIELQERYLTALAQLEYRRDDYKRKEGLYRDSLSSAKSFQESEASFRGLEATVNGIKAKLMMLDLPLESIEKGQIAATIPVKSPINGYVRNIAVNIGKSVSTDQPLFEIVDNDHIHIDLRVYEKDMHKVRVGQKVIFSLSNAPDSVYQGSVFALGRAFEEDPKAMVVHAEMDNHGGNLLPGMYVDARIVSNDEKVLALPNESIVSDGGLNYVFVLESDHHHTHTSEHSITDQHTHQAGKEEFVFRKVEVNTGATDIGFTEVVLAEQVPHDAAFVTNGAFYLLAEMKKGEGGGHGHHH